MFMMFEVFFFGSAYCLGISFRYINGLFNFPQTKNPENNDHKKILDIKPWSFRFDIVSGVRSVRGA